MSEIARPWLLITLVHGTWPRGLFPKIARLKQLARRLLRRKRLGPPPFWFEECSPFLACLSKELAAISHEIKPLEWTGKNSIAERDKIARVLAEHLSAEHAEHPQATQLVIAHSHGGNIALRALHHLRRRDASQFCPADSARPLVVTLATPFVEVQHADFGGRPTVIRGTIVYAIAMTLLIWEKTKISSDALLITGAASLGFLGWYWVSQRAPARQRKVEKLRDATRLGEMETTQAQRLLIIRAIDDEASLLMAPGTNVTYVTARAITSGPWIGMFLSIPLALILFRLTHKPVSAEKLDDYVKWYENAVNLGWCAVIFILLGLLSVARTVHGRDLALSPMECQINTQSTPDALGLSKIVTLVRRSFAKSLRHGIYDHEDCAKAISDWVHSRLCAP